MTVIQKQNINFDELPINVQPDHYKAGGMQPLEYMKIKMTKEQIEGFYLGNVIKYISRYQQKNGLEDVYKAEFYLKELIQSMEGKE